MKKYILTMFLVLLASTCFAGGMLWQGPRYQGVVASGSITAGNLLADLTSDNAFVAPVGVDLSSYQDGRHIFRAVDSSGYVAFGFIMSTPPSGPTLGGAIFEDDCADDSTATWGGIVDTLIFDTDHYELTRNGTSGRCRNTSGFAALTSGALYKFSASIKDGTVASVPVGFRLTDIVTISQSETIFTTTAASVERAHYATANGIEQYVQFYIIPSINGNIEFKLMSLKQLTDPASTGARIVSTKGGATRSWTYRHASFNPNSSCTFEVLFIGD